MVFDIVEYLAQNSSKPSNGPWHDFMKHHELNFNQKAGREQVREEVNRILSRGGTVFEMSSDLEIQRVGTPEVQVVLRRLRPNTGDQKLDELLENARSLYLSRDPADRANAIEKLWDGYERLKTINDPSDKKRSLAKLLNNISDSALRAVIDDEMKALTSVGNNFQIRHHEVGKHAVPADARDYLATRIGTVIVFLLEQSGRMAAGSFSTATIASREATQPRPRQATAAHGRRARPC